ncbi:MAG: hypothetical protein KF830_01275 [Planctomycetes bacterium]|nr:hypothetical protein [Planctomycetota bacterium]
MPAPLLLIALALGAPQDPPPRVADDLRALAARVDAAHRPRGPVPEVTAFRSHIELHLLDADQQRGGQVDLAVQFLLWRPPGRDRPRSLIRYDVLEAGSPIVRGRDRNGPWQLFQGEAQDLHKAEFADDLAACDQHTNLARQLLRCLDPGAVLRSLAAPGPVHEEVLALDRNARIDCQTVAGDLPAFPLLQQGGEDAPVRLKVFVRKDDGRLLAIEAVPLVDGAPDAARLERVHLLELHEQDDLLVPRRIVHLFRKADGRLHPQSRAVLTSLSLRPELGAADFDRPR